MTYPNPLNLGRQPGATQLAWDEFWTPAEAARLDAYALNYRKAHLIEIHHKMGCAWVKGDGRVVVAVEGKHPEERLHV